MNKNATAEREYEFSYDTLIDIIEAQRALIKELTDTILAKDKEIEYLNGLLDNAEWLVDDLILRRAE